MNIYITHDNNALTGYKTVTIDSLINLNFSLSSICYDSQACKIYAPTVLSYIPQDKTQIFLAHLLRLLKRGGHLHVGGIDSIMLCDAHAALNLSVVDLNRIIFEDKPQLQGLVVLSQIKDFFLKNNTTINSIEVDKLECSFTIGVVKNG